MTDANQPNATATVSQAVATAIVSFDTGVPGPSGADFNADFNADFLV